VVTVPIRSPWKTPSKRRRPLSPDPHVVLMHDIVQVALVARVPLTMARGPRALNQRIGGAVAVDDQQQPRLVLEASTICPTTPWKVTAGRPRCTPSAWPLSMMTVLNQRRVLADDLGGDRRPGQRPLEPQKLPQPVVFELEFALLDVALHRLPQLLFELLVLRETDTRKK